MSIAVIWLTHHVSAAREVFFLFVMEDRFSRLVTELATSLLSEELCWRSAARRCKSAKAPSKKVLHRVK